MTLTLLLDLDDTLLGNSMDSFLPAYLRSLCEHLAPFIPAEKLVSTLMSGTQAMLDNNMPDKALKEVFDQVEITYEMGEPETVEKDGMVMIVQNEKSIVQISDEQLQQIINKTEEVRNKLIAY